MTGPLDGPVLVTGATGFLGTHVCRMFAERGLPVRALVRMPESARGAGGPWPGEGAAERWRAGVEIWPTRGLDDAPAIREAMAGVRTVVHLAAHVHQPSAAADTGAEAALFRAVNVDGTRTLLEAATAAGARAFVLASSVKAVGDGRELPYTEETPAEPSDAYGVTKLEAERLVREHASAHESHAPILRLPLVYGPGMKANALRLFDAVARGTPLPLGRVRNRRSFLFAGNFVAAMMATLESEAGNDTFFVSDGADLSTPELVRAIGRALGRPARLLPVPVAALRAAGRAGDALARVAPFPLTSPAVDRLVGSLAIDASRLMRRTGFRPPFTVTEGLRLTAEWYRGRGAGPA